MRFHTFLFIVVVGETSFVPYTALFNSSRTARAMLIAYDNLCASLVVRRLLMLCQSVKKGRGQTTTM
jgi:hypothetical protein